MVRFPTVAIICTPVSSLAQPPSQCLLEILSLDREADETHSSNAKKKKTGTARRT
jgi:hypothetical protein